MREGFDIRLLLDNFNGKKTSRVQAGNNTSQKSAPQQKVLAQYRHVVPNIGDLSVWERIVQLTAFLIVQPYANRIFFYEYES